MSQITSTVYHLTRVIKNHIHEGDYMRLTKIRIAYTIATVATTVSAFCLWDLLRKDTVPAAPAAIRAEAANVMQQHQTGDFIKMTASPGDDAKFISAKYKIDLARPISLRTFLDSRMMFDMLSICSKVSFARADRAQYEKWRIVSVSPLEAVIVGFDKSEIGQTDELLILVYYPGAAN